KSDQQELEHDIPEHTNVPGGHACRLGFGNGIEGFAVRAGQRNEKITEIDLADDQSQGGHNDVIHQGGHDFTKGRANDNPDRKIDHIAAHDEFFEFVEHFFLPSLYKAWLRLPAPCCRNEGISYKKTPLCKANSLNYITKISSPIFRKNI